MMHVRLPAALFMTACVSSHPAYAQVSAPVDSIHATTFTEAFVNELHGADSLARMAFVFVHGSQIVAARGFGKTAGGQNVSAEETIFRAASNSKLLVTVAALQLGQQKRWRLSDDVNEYLPTGSRLRGAFGTPVTIADLLTHTSGIENRLAGAVVPPSERVTLEEFFAHHIPYRAVAPGREISYSNIGMALAGYLVERASGESFEQYAEHHIFPALQMTHSSFRQPAPEEWSASLASGVPVGARNVVFLPYPAASLITTPVDMGHFIIALLNGGRFGESTVIDSVAVQLMLQTHWRAAPGVPGVAYGFFEGIRNNHRYLFHTGDSGDHSLVLLIPDLQFGCYFVFSGSDEQTKVRDQFARAVLDASAGVEKGLPTLPTIDLTPFIGHYRGAAYSRTNSEKATVLVGETVISDGGDGMLLAHPPGSIASVRLKRIGPLAFRSDSGETIAFQIDRDNAVRRFTLNGLVWDPSSWDRVSWYEQARLHRAVLLLLVFTAIFRGIVAPIVGVFNRRQRSRISSNLKKSRRGRIAWNLSGIASALMVACPLVFVGSAFLSFAHPSTAIPIAARNASLVLTLGELLGLSTCLLLRVAWREVSQSLVQRLAFIAFSISCIVALPTLCYVRLLYPLSA